jgi:hypothetical protein
MTSKFVSFLETVGKDFTKFLPAAETAMAIFEPALSPMFNMTVNAVVTAEQSFAAAGKQTGYRHTETRRRGRSRRTADRARLGRCRESVRYRMRLKTT